MNISPFPTPNVVRGGCKKLPICRPDGNTRHILCMISSSGTVYELERKICDAIYGQVRAACVLEDIGEKVFCRTNTFVAIKILNMEKIRSKMGTLTEDPLKELAALQYIGNEHPYIQGQIECVQDSQNIYSVMNLCTGGELLDYVLMNRLSEHDGRNLFRQIVSGVEYLQSKGVSHRDLSLENILLTNEGVCKIIDLGQSLRVPADTDSSGRSLIPHQGMCGKLPYRSPETFHKQPYHGFAIDIWALGVILFMLLTSQQPMDCPDRACDRFTYIVCGELRSLMMQWKLVVSENAMDLMQRMLREEPSERLTITQIQSHPWMHET